MSLATGRATSFSVLLEAMFTMLALTRMAVRAGVLAALIATVMSVASGLVRMGTGRPSRRTPRKPSTGCARCGTAWWTSIRRLARSSSQILYRRVAGLTSELACSTADHSLTMRRMCSWPRMADRTYLSSGAECPSPMLAQGCQSPEASSRSSRMAALFMQ